VLIVRGEEKPENATFLKDTDLFANEGFGPTATTKFRGEDKIIAALSAPGAGGAKAVVYVTQGNGEPDLNDSSPRARLDQGLGVLRDRLNGRGNFDVRPLKFNPADPKVPDDAALVVAANPRAPVDVNVEQALRAYLIDRKGKAAILLDTPPPGYDKETMPATGLERLLGEFNVEVTADRVVHVLRTGGGIGYLDGGMFEINPELARGRNELALAFAQETFVLRTARIVRPMAAGRNAALRAETLLQTRGGRPWAERDWKADLARKVETVLTNAAESQRIVSQEPLPAAVIVSESGPPPMAPGAPPPAAKPRLAVFGDSTLVTNALVSEQNPDSYFSFFASTLDWLAERPTSIGIGSKDLPFYVMDAGAAEKANTRLVWLPVLLALIGIVGLGAGVWVVRRR
jgi:hypothetical protein